MLDRVREQITKLCADVPGLLRAKRAQLAQARGRVARIINFVALGRAQDSKALAEALARDEASVTSLEAEVKGLQSASDSRVRFPSRLWVEKRSAALRELLERRTEASALVLRRLLGRMVLEAGLSGAGQAVLRCADDHRRARSAGAIRVRSGLGPGCEFFRMVDPLAKVAHRREPPDRGAAP